MRNILSIFYIVIQIFVSYPLSAKYIPKRLHSIDFSGGMSGNDVNCILKDKQGYIWIGTEIGLNRYDGTHTKTFLPESNFTKSVSRRLVIDLKQDSLGYIWIVSANKEVILYNPTTEKFSNLSSPQLSNTAELTNNKANIIYPAKDGSVWIGTRNGLNHYVHGKGITEKIFQGTNGNGLSHGQVLSIIESSDKCLWVGTKFGVNKISGAPYKRIISQFIIYSKLDKKGTFDSLSANVNVLYETKEKEIWAGLHDGLFRIKTVGNKSVSQYNSVGNVQILKIIQDSQGDLWIGHSKGLSRISHLSRENEKTEQYFHETEHMNSMGLNPFYHIAEDSYGGLWVAGTGKAKGIYYFEHSKNQFRHCKFEENQNYSIQGKQINVLFPDNRGILWIGTSKAGLFMLDINEKPFQVINFYNDDKGFDASTYVVFEDSKKRLWIGTNEGLFKLEGDKLKKYSFKNKESNGLSGQTVSALAEDKKGLIWIGYMDNQLSSLDTENERFTHYFFDPKKKNSLACWSIRSLAVDNENTLWIGSFSTGLAKLKEGADTFSYFSPTPLPWSNISTHTQKGNTVNDLGISKLFFESGSNNLWIGTNSEGLNKMNLSTGNVEYIVKNTRHNEVLALYMDKNKNIWTSLGSGLSVYVTSQNKWKNIPDDQLNKSATYGILEDNNGKIWLSTSKGIYSISPTGVTLNNYSSYEVGMPKGFISGAYCKQANGLMCFGGINGIVRFFPDSIRPNPFKATAVFTGFKLFNKPIYPGDTFNGKIILHATLQNLKLLELKHSEYDFTIEFAALHYSMSELNRLRYKLEGFDDEWKQTEQPFGQATYIRLPPGEYTFLVEAANSDGIWSGDFLRLTIKILPPWWATWWFRLLAFATLVGIIIAFYLYRERQFKFEAAKLELRVQQRTQQLEEANRLLETKTTQLASKNEEILFISKQLHESDEAKINFFTDISHEFRTPITLLLGGIEQLRTKASEETMNLLEVMWRNSQRLMRLVNQLLDLNTIDKKSYNLQLNNDDLENYVGRIVEQFRPYAIQHRQELSFTSEIIRESLFDADIIEKCVYNLLSNACKYTPDAGSIKISLTNEADGFVCLSVSDNGPGIPEKLQMKVFERFFKASNVAPRKEGSIGLGLTLVKELIQLHHGYVKLESYEGKGSVFSIYFPIAKLFFEKELYPVPETTPSFKILQQYYDLPDTQDDIHENISDEELIQLTDQQKMLILVVDDNTDLRKYIRTLLGPAYQLIEAKNGEDGVKKARKFLPDIIISDVMMPEKDGLALCKELKSDGLTAHIPIILLTAKVQDEQQLLGLQTGADDYIPKPFYGNVLKLKIQNALTTRQKLREKYSDLSKLHKEEFKVNNADEEFMQKLLSVIELNISDTEFDSVVLCKELGLSKTSLYRKIQAIAGLSINNFVRFVRLKRAAELLLQRQYSVSQVGYHVGFNSHSYFTSSFTEQFGMSPSEYIEKQL